MRRIPPGLGKLSGKSRAIFGEKEMVSVDEASERLSGVVRVFGCGCRAIVVRDVLALIFLTSNEGRVEDGSGL